MPKPRKELVCLDTTPYYHCVSRCVRRAFLCGISDKGVSFEHRRQWIEDKLLYLGSVFAIDVCAFAILTNHFHVVLHIDREQALGWSMTEVIERWHRLTRGNAISQRFVNNPSALCAAELENLQGCCELWRERLMDISWLMRMLNESTARRANREDNCTGRFWEGRFKSQALLDEQALAVCMAYVDLNPLRAKMAKTPEASEYTSIKRRCKKAKISAQPDHHNQQAEQLLPFVGNHQQSMPKGLPFRLSEYLELVDWTGRCIRDKKHGTIPGHLPDVLERLQLEPRHWLYMTQNFESNFKGLVGTAYRIKKAAVDLGYRRAPGISTSIQLTA